MRTVQAVAVAAAHWFQSPPESEPIAKSADDTVATLAAGAHESKERTPAPLAVNLISYSSHAEEAKEWSYHEDGAERGGEPVGPITKEEVQKVRGPRSTVRET